MTLSKNIHHWIMFGIVIAVVAASVVAVNTSNQTAIGQKHARCHSPFVDQKTGAVIPGRWNYSMYEYADFKLVGWFYNAPFRSCFALYSIGSMHYHNGNFDLPTSKKECEDLCAEPCLMQNGAPGICMSEDFCQLKEHTFKTLPCKAYNVKCCPRDFVSSQPVPTVPAGVNVKSPKPAGGTQGTRKRPLNQLSQFDLI